MNRCDFAAIGELNVDIILNGIESEPEIGKEKFVEDMTVTLGSSTAIFAANAAALGSRVCVAGMVGRDPFGCIVRSALASKGVDTSFIVDSRIPTGATICMNYGEDRANMTFQGSMNMMGFEDIAPELFSLTGHIHLCSLFFQSGILKDIHRILDKAAENKITISLDPQCDPKEKWEIDFKTVLPKVDIFMPNEHELMAITHTDNIDSAINTVLPYLGNSMVIKCGANGSVLVRNDGSRKILPAFHNPDVVDTIGAGDSFNAGFICAFVKGLSLEDCQLSGNLAGAVNTSAVGGTGAFSSLEEIRKRCIDTFGHALPL